MGQYSAEYITALTLELERRDIDYDTEWNGNPDAKRELKEFFSYDGLSIKSSLDFQMQSGQYIIFLKGIDEKVKWCDIAKAIKDKCLKDEENSSEKLIISFVSSLKERVQQEENWGNFFKSKPKAIFGTVKGIKKSSFVCVVKDVDIRAETFMIDSINRAKIQFFPEPQIAGIEGSKAGKRADAFVLTVKLKSILDLYDKVGDRLFEKNVRYDIGEVLGVDSAIRETLEIEPEMFWYYNNGITIMVEDPDFKVRYADKIILQKKGSRRLKFSVINGAQTINAAANLYFSNNVKRKNVEQAYVLLRIIHIVRKPEKAQKVSVALNRQKPILVSDIAIFSPFVRTFNECAEKLVHKEIDSKNIFYLVKRGEPTDNNGMTLDRFVRAANACKMLPENARNNSANPYLSKLTMEEDRLFGADSIFVDWDREDDTKQQNQYLERYGSVLFANRLEELYKRKKNTVSKSSADYNYKFIIRNAGWYFVSIVIYKIAKIMKLISDNGQGNETFDYSGFPSLSMPNDDQMQTLMKTFGTEICNNARELQKKGLPEETTEKQGVIFKETDLKGTDFREKYLKLKFDDLESNLKAYLKANGINIK